MNWKGIFIETGLPASILRGINSKYGQMSKLISLRSASSDLKVSGDKEVQIFILAGAAPTKPTQKSITM